MSLNTLSTTPHINPHAPHMQVHFLQPRRESASPPRTTMACCLALGVGRLLLLALALALLPARTTAAICPARTLGLSLKGGDGGK